MILRANIRGNAQQLGDYLVALKDNDFIKILEVDGRENADETYLKQVLQSMELNSELTKTNKAFFNIQINPAYGEDKLMSLADVQKAAEIIELETGFQCQRRIIVQHTKKGRDHFHVVWERYNHETGKMVDNKHSRLKVDAARPKIEDALSHQKTPYRNPQRPELKLALTKMWNETTLGSDFIKVASKSNYMIAEGTANRPFMVVDENGRSFDLVRQLQGIKTKEVRARLRNEILIKEKDAIELMRSRKSVGDKEGKTDDASKAKRQIKDLNNFKENSSEIGAENSKSQERKRFVKVAKDFSLSKGDIFTSPERPLANSLYKHKFDEFVKNNPTHQNLEKDKQEKAYEEFLRAKEDKLQKARQNELRMKELLDQANKETPKAKGLEKEL